MKQNSSLATLDPGPKTQKYPKIFNIAHIYAVPNSGDMEVGGECHCHEEQWESESHESAMYVRHWVTVPSDADCSSMVPRTGNPGKNLGLWLSVSSNWHHKLFREKMPLSSGIVRLQNNWEQSLGVHKEFLMRCITSDCLGWGLYVSKKLSILL